MHLPAPDLEAWIDALRNDPSAAARALPSDPLSALQTPAAWHLGMFATAYFYVLNDEDAYRLVKLIPQLHKEFQELTGYALTKYLSFTSGGFARKAPTQDQIEQHIISKADNMGTLAGMDAATKESSSRYLFRTIAQFIQAKRQDPVFRPGVHKPIVDREIKSAEITAGLDYLTINFPLTFWKSRKEEVRTWWLSACERLRPVQAYMGLGMGLPPILERYPFQQPAEFALANRFLGLDVDKPFFVVSNRPDGMNLECGMRTPSFAVLVRGDYLDLLGGGPALTSKLRDERDLKIHPCAGGLWIEAAEGPALYPVEEGVPRHLRVLAEALKPVRLERIWMVSYPPNVPRDDIFSPESSARWLRRFDSDSDWGGLVDGEPPHRPASQSAPPPAQVLAAYAGDPCPQTGQWFAPRLKNRSEYVEQGQRMPGPDHTATGAVVWYLKV